ncbi:MAG: DUF1800 domain-containing protein [Gemmatimonadetes bacterium]|nr:DUF1800 domain-containing protein [Gemmatimonadota bacterium]
MTQKATLAVLLAVTIAGAPRAAVHERGQLVADSVERARALHALNRLTFGPRPGDVNRVAAMGVDRFLDEQLHPERLADRSLKRRLESYEILRTSPAELARLFGEQLRERQQRQQAMAADSSERRMMRDSFTGETNNPVRRLLGQYQQVTMVRDVTSERQLYEVMVDFWTNHFNVFIGKGADRFLLPGYIEETIRPRALGKLEDLLLATAQSPAMLFYLDNAQSVAPGSRPPQLDRLNAARARGAGRFGLRGPRRLSPERMDSIANQIESRMPKGINENYAREVMELHTLGVDGGYTQQDVENLARILTGWSIARPRQSPGFVFNDWAHDRGEKIFLGRTFPAGQGQDEGIEALKLLARQPATMRHLSAKLCARFVNDDPPDGCIDAGVHAWQRSGGDIRQVVRAIVTAPEFWEPRNRNAKIKTPLEFVVSAVRAVGAEPDSTLALAQVVARLGQPLFGQQPPTGYPETQESWVNAGALLQRMNVALGLASGKLPGAVTKLDGIIPATDDVESMIVSVNGKVLSGTASPNTIKTMRDQTMDIPSADMKRAMIVGLALGSPEFQKQ